MGGGSDGVGDRARDIQQVRVLMQLWEMLTVFR